MDAAHKDSFARFMTKVVMSQEQLITQAVECVLERVALEHNLPLKKMQEQLVPYAVKHVLCEVRAAVASTRCRGLTVSGKSCKYKAGDNGYCHLHQVQYDRMRVMNDVNKQRLLAGQSSAARVLTRHKGCQTEPAACDRAKGGTHFLPAPGHGVTSMPPAGPAGASASAPASASASASAAAADCAACGDPWAPPAHPVSARRPTATTPRRLRQPFRIEDT